MYSTGWARIRWDHLKSYMLTWAFFPLDLFRGMLPGSRYREDLVRTAGESLFWLDGHTGYSLFEARATFSK